MKFKGNQLRKFKREETLQKIFLFCMDLYILTKFFYNKHVPYNKEKVRAVLEKNPLLQKQISYCLKSTPLTHYTRPRMVWPGRDSVLSAQSPFHPLLQTAFWDFPPGNHCSSPLGGRPIPSPTSQFLQAPWPSQQFRGKNMTDPNPINTEKG